jgi:sec-independent protein translocase protein TatC
MACNSDTCDLFPDLIQHTNREDPEQALKEHLKELQKRIIRILVVLFISICFIYPFSGEIIRTTWIRLIPVEFAMTVYSPLEWIFVKMKLSLVLSSLIATPIIIYEMFMFAARGLYPNEKCFLKKIVPLSFILFLLGSTIALFLVLPLLLKQIIFYSNDIAVAQVSVQKTFSVVTTLIIGFGFVFQIPLLMLCAIKMDLVNHNTLCKQRIIVYSTFLGFSTFLSPDPTFIAQFICMLMLVVLFEIGLILSKL